LLNKFLTVGRSMNLALIILSRSYRCGWVYVDAWHRLLQPFGRSLVRARDPGSHSPAQLKNAARRIGGRIFYLDLRIIQVIEGDASSVGELISTAFRVMPRQPRSMETVERLLAAGEAIVKRKRRLDRLTMETVADEAGVTPQVLSCSACAACWPSSMSGYSRL
jgi:hypothetical protein